MFENIVVGTDGSDAANKAVEKALQLAKEQGATLHVITVVNTSRYGEPALSSTELVLNELEDRAHKQLVEIEDEAAGRGVDAVTKYFHGRPCRELLDYADEIDCDLIVLGYQGRTHAGSDIGSTANRVIRDTDRSVMLV